MWIIDIAVAVAPVIGYYSQLQLIRTQKSIGSFSIDVCAILLISAILRIYFWIVNGYAINLLFQAMFIIIIQVRFNILRHYCWTNASKCRRDQKILINHRNFGGGTHSINMVCSSIIYLVKFLLIFTGGIGFFTFLSKIIWIPFYGTILGFASLSL